MDVDDLLPVNGLEEGHQNGIHEQLSAAGGEGVIPEKVNGNLDLSAESAGMNGNAENVGMWDDNGIINASTAEVGEGSHIRARVNGLTISEDLEVEDADPSKHSKPQKGQGKSSKEKPSSPKHAGTTWVKKKDGKDEIVTSASTNGSLASISRPKQTLKSRSFSDKQDHLSKQSKNSEAASSTSNMIQPEGRAEKTRLKPVKLGAPTVSDVNTKSPSPTEDTKPRRVAALPSYNFSFRCDERAEKRREFYTKLEEKTHAKEIERTNLQAKSKETQEAEIKMLRKSLTFKATPMPSFYQEPPPPKVELKKIPPTRAKSPKLGRKKSSPAPESEGSSSHRSGRLSLDEKVSQNNPAKGISPGHLKKPLRKSLPKLPSERTNLSKSTNEAAFLSQQQEPVQVPDPSKSQPDADDKSEVEEQAQQTMFQEPSALEC